MPSQSASYTFSYASVPGIACLSDLLPHLDGNEREDLVAVGPVPVEYQAAMLGDELEESAGWTTVGIARVLTGKRARTIAATGG